MSGNRKSLGQVAFEANDEPDALWRGPWEIQSQNERDFWERAAQAVKDAIPLHELADMDQAAFEDFRKKFKAEGAAEERERLASLIFGESSDFDVPGTSASYSDNEQLAAWLRAGGKP